MSAIRELIPPEHRRPVTPQGINHNPDTWRYRLGRWLMGNVLEGVGLLPMRPIGPYDRLIIRLGDGGALNTVEVYHPDMSNEGAYTEERVRRDPWKLLVPIEAIDDLYPETFVFLVIAGKPEGRLLGTFHGWSMQDRKRVAIFESRDMITLAVERKAIKEAYYAPAGLQLSWLEGRPVGAE